MGVPTTSALGKDRDVPHSALPVEDIGADSETKDGITPNSASPGFLKATMESTKEKLKLPELEDSKQAVQADSVATIRRCVVCDQQDPVVDEKVCKECARRLRRSLLREDLSTARAGWGSESYCDYCLVCSKLVRGNHAQHEGNTILLDKLNGSLVAWVTGKERWPPLFHGIQSDFPDDMIMGRPYRLHPSQGIRCEVCADQITPTTLYGWLVRYCTIQCWFSAGKAGDGLKWMSALVDEDFSDVLLNAFCIQCACAFRRREDSTHDEHDVLKVVFDPRACGPYIKVTAGHFMERAWDGIKDWDGGETHCCKKRLLRVRDEGAPRCHSCNRRLENGGGRTCCLSCSLPAPRLLPRQLEV